MGVYENLVKFSVYPNPVSRMLNIELSSVEMGHDTRVVLQNALGQLVYSEQVTSLNSTIDVSDFAVGVYKLAVFQGETSLFSEKVVIQ